MEQLIERFLKVRLELKLAGVAGVILALTAGVYFIWITDLQQAEESNQRQIQKLEDELSAPLFQRHSRGVELTSAGEILLSYAQTSQRQVERVRSEVDALKGLRRGVVHVHAIESLVMHLLPQVIAQDQF